jgi:hypothetical protein
MEHLIKNLSYQTPSLEVLMQVVQMDHMPTKLFCSQNSFQKNTTKAGHDNVHL